MDAAGQDWKFETCCGGVVLNLLVASRGCGRDIAVWKQTMLADDSREPATTFGAMTC